MKRLLLLVSMFCLFAVSGVAQNNGAVYVFPDFIKVKIQFKNKTLGQATANYDAGLKRLLFKQGDVIMESTNVATIDTIYFGERRFIPAAKGLTEVMKLEHGTVKIDWWLKKVMIGSKGAFGSVTQGTVQRVRLADLGDSQVGFSTYTHYEPSRENDNEIFRSRNANVYYITVEGKEYKLKELKNLYKQFPDKAGQIKAYANENKLDLRTADNALKLLDYVLSL